MEEFDFGDIRPSTALITEMRLGIAQLRDYPGSSEKVFDFGDSGSESCYLLVEGAASYGQIDYDAHWRTSGEALFVYMRLNRDAIGEVDVQLSSTLYRIQPHTHIKIVVKDENSQQSWEDNRGKLHLRLFNGYPEGLLRAPIVP